jgi:hypothetical protein
MHSVLHYQHIPILELERNLPPQGSSRRETITIRGQSYVSRLPKY